MAKHDHNTGGNEKRSRSQNTSHEDNARRPAGAPEARGYEQDKLERTGSLESPYDVGSYASHYDDRAYNTGNQSIGTTWRQQPLKGRDNRGKGPRGYQRSDQRILEDVNDRLFLDPYVDASDIEVRVEKCDVTLTGVIADKNAKRLAEDIAWSVAGVKNVDNKLRIAKTHVAGPVRSHAREQLM